MLQRQRERKARQLRARIETLDAQIARLRELRMELEEHFFNTDILQGEVKILLDRDEIYGRKQEELMVQMQTMKCLIKNYLKKMSEISY